MRHPAAPFTIGFWLVSTLAAEASADSKQCVAANDDGTGLRQQGKLVEAREKFLICAAASCPKIVRDECQGLVQKLDASIPTVVFAVSDAQGNDLTNVKVTLDGVLVASSLDGRAVPLNPGEHRVKIETADGGVLERSLLAREGEKNRTFSLVVGAKAETPAPPVAKTPAPEQRAPSPGPSSHVSPLAWVLGGVGVVALGSFSYFALRGKSQENDLESSCAPNCSHDDYSSMKQKYLVADVSLGVGVLALGAATYFFLHPTKEAPPPAVSLLGGATSRGGFIGARARF